MLKHPLFPAVASSCRRKLLAAPMMLLAIGLLAVGCSIVPTASAEPYCDRPDPPPACDGGPEEPVPPAPPEGKPFTLTATSYHGTVSVYENGSPEFRVADSWQPFHLKTTYNAFPWTGLRVTESWLCGWGGHHGGTFTTEADGDTYTVADPESRCPGEGLYQSTVTAAGFYILLGGPLVDNRYSTAELTISVHGRWFDDDRRPIIGPW